MKRAKELDTGNVEYKLTLTNLLTNQQKLDSLATQMHFRLGEGGGEAIYLIGVEDDGRLIGISETELEESENTLTEISALINAKVSRIRIRDGEEGKVGEYLIRRIIGAEDLPIDITIDTVGNVDSGKSTIIGCLISNELDDGRGSARLKVLRHLHEIESGRTSSVSHQVLGFDAKGRTVNYSSPSASVSPLTMNEVVENSSKIISFVDLAGHERYLKTTIFGLAGYAPDYSLLVIGANAGVLRMTKEHLGVSAALKIPMIVVINKIDLVNPEITKRTQDQVKSVLKLPGVDKIPMIIKNYDDMVVASKHMPSGRVAPIFKISCVTGEGFDLLRNFLNLVPARLSWFEYMNDEFLLYIDEVFSVPGVGTVVSGTINRGTIHSNDTVKLGPFSGGALFKETKIRSIQYKRLNVRHLHAGQSGTFALHGISYDEVRKGMILTQMEDPPTARSFSANVFVLYHPTTIRMGYEAVIHVNTVRQTAKIIEMSEAPLRTGQRANVTFRFKYKPEYIMEGQKILFREGRTKGIGIITSIEN
ncbi:MAG: GTP-binding protein [Promethearchaeota archaeon]